MKIALVLVPLLALGLTATGCAAEIPAPAAPAPEGMATVALNQRASFRDIEITPIAIEEDSRCPTGVQCVWAGTVRIAVRIAESRARREAVLTLGQPFRLASGRWVTLAAVCPHLRHPVAIRPASYRFTFGLGLTAPAPPLDFLCTPPTPK